jgi:heme exporter protein B
VGREAAAVAAKEIRLAVRGRTGAAMVVAFAALALALMAFAFGPEAGRVRGFAPGALWLTFFFAGQFALQGTFAVEGENAALEGFLATGADRLALFVGKLAAGGMVMGAVEAVGVPLYLLFFSHLGEVRLPLLAASLAMGDAGFLAAGVLLAAVTSHARAGEAVFPLALFPVTVPVLLAGVATTRAALAGGGGGAWWELLAGYDAMFLALSLLLFESALEVE